MATAWKPVLLPGSMMWAESTVRWLNEHHPGYLHHASSRTWPEKLVSALVRMSWQEVELVKKRGLVKEAYVSKIRETVTGWSRAEHENVMKFIAKGGYEAEAAMLDEEVFTVISADGTEGIALEMDEVYDAVSDLSPKAEMSPDHELEEIVATATKQTDPRYGAW